jgi:hypothetical protein
MRGKENAEFIQISEISSPTKEIPSITIKLDASRTEHYMTQYTFLNLMVEIGALAFVLYIVGSLIVPTRWSLMASLAQQTTVV